jgi:uncharacterized protein YjbI with pentapeptide repeats
MGDGTQEKPFIREDVMDIISRRGGDTFGLNLSGKHFEGAIDLRNLKLIEIILNEAVLLYARFDGSNLKWAKLREANLQHARFNSSDGDVASLVEADLSGALLQDASFREADLEMAKFGDKKEPDLVTPLFDTDFRGADLHFAEFYRCSFFRTKLEGAYLRYANIHESNLEGVDWGNYKIGEENDGDFYSAESVYRQLKMWYTNAGIYDVAGEFFYREMEVRRKAKSWKKEPASKLWSWIMKVLCGYGEKPERVIISAVVFIFGLAAIYYFWGSFNPSSFLDTLYYSVTSFTAVGYGSWVPQPTGWAKGMGAAEAVLGVFMMALFLVTFVRKMTR